MAPTRGFARLTGALYLFSALLTPFGMYYVPGKVFVEGNAAATARNLLTHETLFRASILTDLIVTAAFAITIVLLYWLLQGVNRVQASLMAVLGLIYLPISFFTLLCQVAALDLLHHSGMFGVFDQRQVESLIMLLLALNGPAILVCELFWGLWLFPFGLLVMRSGFLPRILGVLLIAAGAGYVALCVTGVLAPGYVDIVKRVTLPLWFGELWIMLWLVVVGVKRLPVATAVPA